LYDIFYAELPDLVDRCKTFRRHAAPTMRKAAVLQPGLSAVVSSASAPLAWI